MSQVKVTQAQQVFLGQPLATHRLDKMFQDNLLGSSNQRVESSGIPDLLIFFQCQTGKLSIFRPVQIIPTKEYT